MLYNDFFINIVVSLLQTMRRHRNEVTVELRKVRKMHLSASQFMLQSKYNKSHTFQASGFKYRSIKRELCFHYKIIND